MLMLKGLVRSLFQTGLFAAVLLIPAGTWHWPRAIQFLVVFALLSLVSIFCLARWAPASLEARVQRGAAKDQPTADRIAARLLRSGRPVAAGGPTQVGGVARGRRGPRSANAPRRVRDHQMKGTWPLVR